MAFQFLESKMTELDTEHESYNQAFYESNIAEAEIEKELESKDVYKTHFLTAKVKVRSLHSTMSVNIFCTEKFHGKIKEWLLFWSQFKKINDNVNLSIEYKFQYLIQMAVPGSRASELTKRDLVEMISTAERKKMLSRRRLTERAISAEAHRTCYLGLGSQKMLSQTHIFIFEFCSGSPARALIKPLFLQNWFLKIVKNIRCNSLTMILTIYYTSSGGSKNVPSQFGA